MNSKALKKKKFIAVRPKSLKAKSRFQNEMKGLNSCIIESNQDGKLFLSSISNEYYFCIPETGDEHWEIIK